MRAHEATPTDSERTSRLLLPRVSRTFALGIKLLPARLEAPVRLGYLLCRIADTIEDELAMAPERKAQLLDEFSACFKDSRQADAFGECIGELRANDDYVELVSQTGAVFAGFRALDAPTRAILEHWVTEMVAGMRRIVLDHPDGIRLGSLDAFREYCYYVAGTVGHLLTELWREHSAFVGQATYERLLEDCEAFGEALQTVNILKDIAWDAEHENAIFVPADLLHATGSGHDALLREDRRTANRAALTPLMDLANSDIERGLRYIEAIPAAAMRIRLFCALPLLFAIATMRELEGSDEMLIPGSAVKIGRPEVRALVIAGSTSALTNRTLRWLADRVRKRPFTLTG